MKLPVQDIKGQQQGDFEIKFELIENGRGTQAVHDTVVAYMANQRSGTACAKTVGEVAGTNRKPWRQKGTGRARAGSFRSPLWAGGGVVFGPRPRDFSKKVNAKTKQLSLRKALSERLKAGDVLVLADFKLASPKTKDFTAVLSKLGVKGSALVVVDEVDNNLRLSSRNVPRVEVTGAHFLHTYQVLKSDKLLMTKSAFEKLEARLKD
jgi:large subunit ribosomal protein L4